jgi:PKD repeat protein
MDHNGFAAWPAGDPENDGGVEPSEPPAAGSPAANWRLARVDGNGDGEINVSDITTIAQHWNERLDGYHVYRRGPEDEAFTRLEDPLNPGQPWLIGRETTYPPGASAPDPLRPVCYTAADEFAIEGEYFYYVVAYDAEDDEEGPASTPASTEGYQPPPDELTADLVAAPLSGNAPLTVYFNAGGSTIPVGAVPNYEWDWHNDDIYDLDSGTDYAVSYTFADGGEYLVLLRVTDSLGGQDTDTVSIAVNAPPQVELVADTSEGDVPLTVSFDGSASMDADGSIVLWEWDLDGDRVYEISSPDQNTAEHIYDQIDTCFPSLRVTDDQGATATAELTITAHGWWTTTIASGANFGRYNSLAIIDGNPAVAFYQHGTQEDQCLWYIRALDPAGRHWGDALIVDGDGQEGDGSPEQRGPECCMIEVEGAPAIAYYDDHDFVGQNLTYIRALDSTGSTWGEPVALTVLLDGRIGWNNSMAIVNGTPAIACNSNATVGGGRILCYFHALDALGENWGGGWKVLDTAWVLEDLQLTLLGDDDQVPAVVYIAFDINTDPYGYIGGLRIVYANDLDGVSWRNPHEFLTYDGIPDSQRFDGLSLLMIDYKPFVVFAGELSIDAGSWLYCMASETMSGSEWGAPLAISPQLPNHTNHSSAAFIGGQPAVVFSSYNRYSVEYLRADDEVGATWSMEPQLIDPAVGRKVECCLLEADGRPVVSYYDDNDSVLKFGAYY